MVTLVDFLLARIADDEEGARLVRQPYRLYVDGEGVISEPLRVDDPWSEGNGQYETWEDGADRLPNRHTYWEPLYDPVLVLAECQAKRRIVEEEHTSTYGGGLVEFCGTCGWDQTHIVEQGGCFDRAHVHYPCRTVRLLALPYAGHPGYREEWRP